MRLQFVIGLILSAVAAVSSPAAENTLSEREKADGWRLLFDGKTLDGWKADGIAESKRPVEDGCINPHLSGGISGMYYARRPWSDFILALDFKVTKNCNSGVFVRTWPLKPPPGTPGNDPGFNALEVQILDKPGADYGDAGAIYDLVKPKRNALRPAGQWNHLVVTCDKNLVLVEMNGEKITRMDLDEWTQKGKRPDGSPHKFPWAWKDHSRQGYIGLQDHGSDCWFKNIKLKPLP
jgi:hypothetical protein